MKVLYPYWLLALGLGLWGWSGCHKAPARPAAPPVPAAATNFTASQVDPSLPPNESLFQGARAFRDLERQVEMGPRSVGSPGAEQLRLWLQRELHGLGYKTGAQVFTAQTPLGPKKMFNILAWAPLASPATQANTIILSTHHDTKYFTDFTFVGANDGASGVALLLELARVFKERPLTKHNLLFAFWDGEEALQEWSAEDSLYGSRHFVESLDTPQTPFKLTTKQIVAVINMDMVGDRHLQVTYDTLSHPQLLEMLFTKGRDLRFEKNFKRAELGNIADDHLPFLQRSIPAINLIGFNQTGAGSYPPYWHTAEDTLDKVSATSLQIAGSTVDLLVRDLDRILE